MDDPLCPPPTRPEIPTDVAAAEETAGRSNPHLQWRRRLRVPHINRGTDDGVDRISNLPGQIIHHIVSFLPTAEATLLSAVSKTFRSVMDSFPIIDFDFDLFVKNSNTRFKPSEETQLKKFLNYVDDTIKRRRSHELDCCIQKFRLVAHLRFHFGYIWGWTESVHQINRAISFAMERGVKELEIALPYSHHFLFPKLITSSAKSNSITTVKLKGIKLDLNDLILSCPMIVSLSLAECTLKDVDILIPNLRAFDLQRCDFGYGSGICGVKIEAVNLQSFTCRGKQDKFIGVEIGACKNLKNLTLYNFRIIKEWFHEQISQFHGLENLTLEECNCLGGVEISHQNLRSLFLLDCDAEDVKVDAPTLVSFMYKGNYFPIRLLNPRAAADLDVTLMFRPWSCDNVECFVRFQNLLSSFGHCKALTLCCFGKDLIFPICLRDILESPLCNLKHLKLITDSMPCYAKLVDGLLWLAPHLETLCFSSIEPILDSPLDLKHLKVITVSMPCYTKLVDGLLWLASYPETLSFSSIETKDQVSKAKFIKFYYGNTQGGGGGGGGGDYSNCLVEMANFEEDTLLKYIEEKRKLYHARYYTRVSIDQKILRFSLGRS